MSKNEAINELRNTLSDAIANKDETVTLSIEACKKIENLLLSGKVPNSRWTATDMGRKGGSTNGASKIRGDSNYYKKIRACRGRKH